MTDPPLRKSCALKLCSGPDLEFEPKMKRSKGARKGPKKAEKQRQFDEIKENMAIAPAESKTKML